MMVYHWSWSDSKSPQISGILLSILAVFNNAVVWTVFTRPLISKSSSPLIIIIIIIIILLSFESFSHQR